MASNHFRIAVLYGGESAEREVSIASGQQVALSLSLSGHQPVLIDPAEVELEAIDWPSFDVCFLALHGGAGEDGRVQAQLDQLGIPYTGSGPTASRRAMKKSLAKQWFQRHGVSTLPYQLVDACLVAWDIMRPPHPDPFPGGEGVQTLLALVDQLRLLGFPLVIKPDNQGSSLGVSIARNPTELPRALAAAAEFADELIAEPLVAGREFTVSLLGRDPLPMIEIRSPHQVFSYDAKYSNTATEHRFDSGLPAHVEAQIYRAAIGAAEALGTAGLVRIDLMLDAQHQPWVLEVNTIPGMTARSLSPKSAQAVGIDMPALVDWMVRDAWHRASHRPSPGVATPGLARRLTPALPIHRETITAAPNAANATAFTCIAAPGVLL